MFNRAEAVWEAPGSMYSRPVFFLEVAVGVFHGASTRSDYAWSAENLARYYRPMRARMASIQLYRLTYRSDLRQGPVMMIDTCLFRRCTRACLELSSGEK